jgi:hypothetical protein
VAWSDRGAGAGWVVGVDGVDREALVKIVWPDGTAVTSWSLTGNFGYAPYFTDSEG